MIACKKTVHTVILLQRRQNNAIKHNWATYPIKQPHSRTAFFTMGPQPLPLSASIHVQICVLLSVSCPSANKISAIFLLHLAQSSSNSPRSSEGLRRTLKANFNWNRQQMKNFPKDPHCKNRPLWATL